MKPQNMIQTSRIVVIFYLMVTISAVAGCSKPEPPQVKPEVVRQKISGIPQAVKPIPIPMPISTPLSGAAIPLPSDTSTINSPDTVGADVSQKKAAETSPKPAAAETPVISVSYNPSGKIDPFVPLLKDDPVKPVQVEKARREKREPMTPLERVDLSQLKLTAIVRTPSGFKAMVEETTGKGYIVGVGTYMGIHSGKVVSILKDRVVVDEEIEDALGNVVNRNSELKFQKPSGD